MQRNSSNIRTDRITSIQIGGAGGGTNSVLDRVCEAARRTWLVLVGIFILLSPNTCTWAQSTGPSEYEIKAACLYNFAKFIDWPEEAFEDDDQPFSIGILGKDPCGAALQRVVKDKTIGDRKIVIRRTSGYTSCQLLFISSSESENISRVLEFTEGLHIVTVSELEGFAELGGTIEFFIEENTVRFAINVDGASRAGVKMDPELLRLSTVVEDDPPPKESQQPSKQLTE